MSADPTPEALIKEWNRLNDAVFRTGAYSARMAHIASAVNCLNLLGIKDLLSRSPEPLVKALEQARREYGAFGSLSGETLSQMDAALRAALAPGEGKDVGQK